MPETDDQNPYNEPGRQRIPGKRPPRPAPTGVWIALIMMMIIYALATNRTHVGSYSDKLATSEFISAVQDERVVEVSYKLSDHSLTGWYYPDQQAKEQATEDDKGKQFTSTYAGEDNLAELMAAHPDVKYTVNTQNNDFLEAILFSVVPTVLMVGALLYFLSQMQGQNGQAMNFGRTRAKTTEENRPKTKFSDVAGIDEAVEELQEVRDFLANPERYQRMGAKIPRGVLLVGPPGTGKTLLAKAVAGEAGVPFFSISGSDFVEMFVGVGASRVRDLFKQAKAAAPCIIFIDEIDAVGRQRGAGLGGGHDEREQTLNQLLVEMDGFAENETVILIAATNRPDILDPALLRPGRFDRQITVDRADVGGREQILRVHAAGKPIDPTVSFETLAKLTPGFTGADLANLMNEAALLAARRNKQSIGQSEFQEAMERVIAGPERKSRIITEKERRVIAYHEAGHALVGHVLENSNPVHKISIISRGRALGYTLQLPEEDHFLQTRDAMLDELAVFLAGRSAEELFCDDITTGASNDLERATKMAREMVTRYGMSESLGTQVFGEPQHQVFLGRDYANRPDYSAETAKRIDDEVERIMREAHSRALAVLEDRREQMDLMASVLLEHETVEGDAATALLDNKWDEFLAAHPGWPEVPVTPLIQRTEQAEAAKRDAQRGADYLAQQQAPEALAAPEAPAAPAAPVPSVTPASGAKSVPPFLSDSAYLDSDERDGMDAPADEQSYQSFEDEEGYIPQPESTNPLPKTAFPNITRQELEHSGNRFTKLPGFDDEDATSADAGRDSADDPSVADTAPHRPVSTERWYTETNPLDENHDEE